MCSHYIFFFFLMALQGSTNEVSEAIRVGIVTKAVIVREYFGTFIIIGKWMIY